MTAQTLASAKARFTPHMLPKAPVLAPHSGCCAPVRLLTPAAMLSSWTSCVPAVDIDGYRVGDPFIAFACQQRRSGTTKQALHAYDAAFKRFNDTAHSQKLHEEMRKSYVGFSECTSIDMTVATKLKMQRAYSAGLSVYQWHPQTFLLPADYAQFERTYKARPG